MSTVLPASIARLQVKTGAHRKGKKILIHGHSKAGKSLFAASAPKPLLALAVGEPGIVMYLEQSKGDVGLEIYTAADFYAALQFGLDNPTKFKTIVIDNFNLFWEQLLEEKADEKGREIRGQDWREIKGPLKAALRRIMRSEQNVVITCWTKDILYTKEESTMPGIEGKTVILAQDNPQIEKTVPYAVDLIFRADVIKDKLFRPTNIHTVTFVGGRRPVSVPPEALHTGKMWKFDSKKPVNVWDTIIAPIEEKWLEGAVDHLDIDEGDSAQAAREMQDAFETQEIGRLCKRITQFVGTGPAYVKLWQDEIAAPLQALGDDSKKLVRDVHDKKKKELGL